jgi:hypothetical protein
MAKFATTANIPTVTENEVLKRGDSFRVWRKWSEKITLVLVDNDVVEIVFHDIPYFEPRKCPVKQDQEDDRTYNRRLREWKKQDRLTRSLILSRLADDIRPYFGTTYKTAKELFDAIEYTYRGLIRRIQ